MRPLSSVQSPMLSDGVTKYEGNACLTRVLSGIVDAACLCTEAAATHPQDGRLHGRSQSSSRYVYSISYCRTYEKLFELEAVHMSGAFGPSLWRVAFLPVSLR